MQTVRQAFTILKQNPLLSTISILGTAFAITMIMAIVITWQTKYADLEPEVNRSRCLYFSAMHVYDKEKDGNNNWSNPSAAFMYGAQNETYIEGWEKKTSNLLIYKRLCKI